MNDKEFVSKFDSSRKTVGKIYSDLQSAKNREAPEVGDMTREIIKGYVEDLNEALSQKKDSPFYVLITEKRDLQMKSAIRRTITTLDKRPWPEDNTTVFRKDPKIDAVFFCWDLPHWSEIPNILANRSDYNPELIGHIYAWKKFDLTPFGFVKGLFGRWVENVSWKDRRIA